MLNINGYQEKKNKTATYPLIPIRIVNLEKDKR